MLDTRLASLRLELEKVAPRLARLQQLRSEQGLRRDAIRQAMSANGGNRLAQIEAEIGRQQSLKDERARRSAHYEQLAQALGLSGAASDEGFRANQRAIDSGQEKCVALRNECQNSLTEAGVLVRELGASHGELTVELESLRQRRSNIPVQMLKLRELL